MITSRMREVGHLGHMREIRNAYKIVTGKPGQTRELGRPRHRWEGNGSLENRVRGCGLN
jgi:hypothetical protein